MSAFGNPQTQVAFSVFENKGVFALLLGSGLSRSAEIPTGWEITTDLVRRVATAEGVEEQANWAKWYQDKYDKEPEYSGLLDSLSKTPAERRQIIHSYIEPDDEDREEGRKVPTVGHRAIARLVRDGFIRVIVTTNFDRLMENALREEGVEPTIVSSPDALKGAEPLAHSTCYILKLHGDYKDTRILNTEEELGFYPAEYNTLLDRILDEYGLIVCGWSGEWDHALRAAILRTPNRRYPMFWATRGALKGREKELCDHRRGIEVPISDADKFFSGLSEQVETLSASRKRNPADVELLVARAKRYLTKPEHRISLSDLFAGELQRVIDVFENPEMQRNDQDQLQNVLGRISAYESTVEGLAKLAGLVGRWGGISETQEVRDAIRALATYGDSGGGGYVILNNLRNYPAALVLESCSLGMAKAGKWSELRRLLQTSIETRSERERSFLSHIQYLAWEGNDNSVWNQIPGYTSANGRRKTPLSDHLYDTVFSAWAPAFLGGMQDYAFLYGLIEVLSGILYLESQTEEALKEALGKTNSYRDRMYMPVGRSAWHSEMGGKIERYLQRAEVRSELLAAGYAHGSDAFLSLVLDNHQRCARALSF